MSVDRVEIRNDTVTRIHEPGAQPASAQSVASGQPSDSVPQDRPQWLPPKFQSPEELARAYSELESRFTQVNQQTLGDKAAAANISEEEMRGFSNEFMQLGTLSDRSFADLEARGIPRYVVESYIEGQKAVAESQVASIYNAVGGQQQYEAMIGWAAESLPDNEIDAFNAMIDSGDPNMVQFAVQGLQARFSAVNGVPRLVQGGTAGPGTSPFRSLAEVTAAMRDPKYRADPAYRKDVEARLAISNIF